MKVIIEGYNYSSEAVRDVLHELNPLESLEHKVSINYVGYYYNPNIHDCIFILPKVLVNEEDKVFGRLDPHEIIHLDDNNALTNEERNFIYEFAVWIYRSISVYNKQNSYNEIIYRRLITEVGKGKRIVSNTFLDILLSILRFNKENQHFFVSILKESRSGHNKVNWSRTINKTQAIIQDSEPIYPRPINKKREINFDEELLVIFFSILSHINCTYGFPVSLTFGFSLIKGKQFDHYLKGYGVRRLKQIKYRYFSDKALRLWELCYAFFEKSHRINVVTDQREYLLAKNYNIVFEAIIDELIGDKNVPRGLKDHEDGKRVDHIYSYQSLTTTENRPIYYIGDSKYYKIGKPITKESVYKQFTYARNVIQWNLNLFLDSQSSTQERELMPKYRDDETEGYNIVPNFFISAKMDKGLSYADNITTTSRTSSRFNSRHYENRLFDRDTLLVYHYDVNFLYVVSLYARENEHQKAQWRTKVRSMFREKLQKELQEQYDFYVMTPNGKVDSSLFVQHHFQKMLGKVYKPYSEDYFYSLALDSLDPNGDNEALLATLKEGFIIEKCQLGQDPSEVIPNIPSIGSSPIVASNQGVLMVMMENYENRSTKFMDSGVIAIGIKQTKAAMDIIQMHKHIGYILFHVRRKEGQHLFKVNTPPIILTKEEVEKAEIYPNIKATDIYLKIDFDSINELPSNHIDVTKKIVTIRSERYDSEFVWIEELMK